jgi:hypothetical protein
MTHRPPIADWPERDRALWEKGVEPKGLFEGGGVGAGRTGSLSSTALCRLAFDLCAISSPACGPSASSTTSAGA